MLDPDIFISTWSLSGKTHKMIDSSANENSTIFAEELKYKVGAKIVDVEEFDENYYDNFQGVVRPQYLKINEPIHSRSMIPHFYKIYRCNEIKNKYALENNLKYDCVIRLRPDLHIKHSIGYIINNINLQENIYVSLCSLNPGFQFSDKFVIMNDNSSNYYSSVWSNLSEYWKNPSGMNPPMTNRVGERLMFEHMNKQDMQIKFFNLGSKILR